MPHNREVRYASEAEAHAFADGIELVNDGAITPLEIRELPDGGYAAYPVDTAQRLQMRR